MAFAQKTGRPTFPFGLMTVMNSLIGNKRVKY